MRNPRGFFTPDTDCSCPPSPSDNRFITWKGADRLLRAAPGAIQSDATLVIFVIGLDGSDLQEIATNFRLAYDFEQIV